MAATPILKMLLPFLLVIVISITSLLHFDVSCYKSNMITNVDYPYYSGASTTKTSKSTETETNFDRAVQLAYNLIDTDSHTSSSSKKPQPRIPPKFDVTKWDKKTTGGLQDSDRILLAKLYGTANAVFEYGLGESTYIADAVRVPRYAGIDSDATWVALARDKVSSHFRFYFADIGTTIKWGHPQDAELSKNILHYQLMPLIVEDQPFDVYMADGRWRIPCMIVSFLHASARGADPMDTIVLLHDCFRKEKWNSKTEGHFPAFLDNRPNYRSADHILDLVQHSGNRLCVFKRKPETTDQQLYEFWQQNYRMID
jgi:hypothetical protein